MLKKRLIFTLLYSNGQFMLSRNFRLQKVGSLHWLQTNYNFSHISYSIDELVILDVSRGEKDPEKFCDALKNITEGCFVPIAAGGGISTIESASKLLRSGADKIVVNSALYRNNGFISELTKEFGQQCIVASMDVKAAPNESFQVWSQCGSERLDGPASEWIEKVCQLGIGELYLNSMDRDGTGQGYDLRLLDLLPTNMPKPVILAGGVGNASHLEQGLIDPRVDAVATAHLFNFIGNGLKQSREFLISGGVSLPVWDIQLLEQHLRKENKSDRLD